MFANQWCISNTIDEAVTTIWKPITFAPSMSPTPSLDRITWILIHRYTGSSQIFVWSHLNWQPLWCFCSLKKNMEKFNLKSLSLFHPVSIANTNWKHYSTVVLLLRSMNHCRITRVLRITRLLCVTRVLHITRLLHITRVLHVTRVLRWPFWVSRPSWETFTTWPNKYATKNSHGVMPSYYTIQANISYHLITMLKN
jgi:hypothetical protein